MKKSFHLFLALVMCLCLCACGDGNRTNPKSTTKATKRSTTKYTYKLEDSLVKQFAAIAVRKEINSMGSEYDSGSSRWSVNKIERKGDDDIYVYGTVSLYDKYGSFKRSGTFTVEMTNKGSDAIARISLH